ncbi:hypothetical protein [Nocardia heshunensis]
MTDAQWDLAPADFDDLVDLVREADVDTHEIEAVTDALRGVAADPAPETVAGIKRRLIVYALRYGGKALAWLLKHFSKEAASYVLRHSTQLADFLDRAENWATEKITEYLVRLGVPRRYAAEIARAIMALAG